MLSEDPHCLEARFAQAVAAEELGIQVSIGLLDFLDAVELLAARLRALRRDALGPAAYDCGSVGDGSSDLGPSEATYRVALQQAICALREAGWSAVRCEATSRSRQL